MIFSYPTKEEVLALHYAIILKTWGSQGVRDMHLFNSLCEKPMTTFDKKALYPDIYSKAAVYLDGFAKFHVFIDGNKRTAFAVAKRFLYQNGFQLKPKREIVANFMVSVVEEKLDIKKISLWLKNNSRKIKP